jgi:hypothetical protein
MKKIFLLIIINIIITSYCFSQGTVRGKVSDENGEKLIGVTLILKNNPTISAITDVDGNYSLKITDPSPQIVVVSYVGYNKVEETINPKNNEVLIKNFQLTSSKKVIGEVKIIGKQQKEQDYYMENIKKKSATTFDYISSESMKKIGDNNVAAAVARVSGVSTNGSFITVRGIGDRYIKTTVNGLQIPTLDPFTNNIKLDLIPSSLVDNIIITKTQSPDLPGDWTAAYISVETKDFPEKFSLNIETTVGYNDQSTLQTVLSSQRSSTDWLGFDNNLRDISHNNFSKPIISPSQYQEFVALGLGDYYKSLGVNSNESWNDGTTEAQLYFKLGLIQLGILPAAQIYDDAAFIEAKNTYNTGSYKKDAFNIINANLYQDAQSLKNNWNTVDRTTPLNFSQTISIGNQTKLFGKKLGFLASFRYGNSNIYDPVSVSQRARFDRSLSQSLTQRISKETNGWSSLFSLSYNLNKNNNISFLFMPNISGANNVRTSVDTANPTEYLVTEAQFYEERKQFIYQFKSDHYIKRYKLKIKTNASYTLGKSTAPDFKNVQYLFDPVANAYQIGGAIGDGIHRYYRYLSENIFDAKVSGELPISTTSFGGIRKLKVGASFFRNDRKSDLYDYEVLLGPYASLNPLTSNNINNFLSLERFGIVNGTDAFGVDYSTIDFFYDVVHTDADRNFGYTNILAAYGLLDYSINSLIRFSGGLRIEQAKIYTDAVKYDSLALKPNDPRRDYSNGTNPIANPGKLNQTSFLPSLNIIYKLKDDKVGQINLRANFSQAVARPSLRELSDIAILDYEFRATVFGNSDLKMVNIKNYDARIESFFKSGDDVSFSLFYKDFKNHIELINAGVITWQNVDRSYAAGIEIEGKKVITKQIEFKTNITLVKSNTEFVRSRLELGASGIRNYVPVDTISRPMFGQAPFIINGILSYTSDSLGLTATVSYNVQGKRLVIASSVKEIPDIYEMPRNIIDIKISKKLNKHFSLSFTVRDVLNTKIRRTYNYTDDGPTIDFDSFRYGTNYILGISYKI